LGEKATSHRAFTMLAPHRDALFTLYPLSDAAKDVTQDPLNRHLISRNPVSDQLGIDVGHHRKSKLTLATLGRQAADIYISHKCISRFQCSFEIHEQSRTVMLYDRSHNWTTQVFRPDNARSEVFPFESRRKPRQVIVAPDVNTIIGMGGNNSDLILFEIVWWEGGRIHNIPEPVLAYSNLAKTCTIDETEAPSRRETRIHTPLAYNASLPIRYTKGADPIGKGRFGTVYKAVDVDSGSLLAVKIISKSNEGFGGGRDWAGTFFHALKNEIHILSILHHVSSLLFRRRCKMLIYSSRTSSGFRAGT
jgi:hypothetical protein